MSRLFDALENIEKKYSSLDPSQHTGVEFMATTAAKKKGKPLYLYFAFLIFIVAIVAWGIYYFGDKVKGDRGTVGLSAANTSQLKIVDSNLKTPGRKRADRESLGSRASFPKDQMLVPAPRHSEKNGEHIFPEPAALLSRLSQETGHAAKLDKSRSRHSAEQKNMTNRKADSKKGKAGVEEQKASGMFAPEVKRMLQQAEELRAQGRVDQAGNIYHTLWRRTRSPLIANNLAACLISSGKFAQARVVLEQALKLSPNDPDLQYNLDIVLRSIQ